MRQFQCDSRLTYRILLAAIVALTVTGCRKKTDDAASAIIPIPWVTDWQTAKETARAEGKDLLINFAGSDWCYWCKKLDAEILSRKVFVDGAAKHFVFMLVDFPHDTSGQSPELQKQNEQLSEQFSIEGFPTVILADAEGHPYAETGYVDEGPRAYLEHLQQLQKQKGRP